MPRLMVRQGATLLLGSHLYPPQAIFQGLWTGVGCGVAGLLGKLSCRSTVLFTRSGHPLYMPPLLAPHSPIPIPAAGGVLYGTHGPALLFQASGIAILGSTALAAAVLVAVRWRRKRRPALLPSTESFDKLPH